EKPRSPKAPKRTGTILPTIYWHRAARSAAVMRRLNPAGFPAACGSGRVDVFPRRSDGTAVEPAGRRLQRLSDRPAADHVQRGLPVEAGEDRAGLKTDAMFQDHRPLLSAPRPRSLSRSKSFSRETGWSR